MSTLLPLPTLAATTAHEFARLDAEIVRLRGLIDEVAEELEDMLPEGDDDLDLPRVIARLRAGRLPLPARLPAAALPTVIPPARMVSR